VTAYRALELLHDAGFRMHDEDIRKGFAGVDNLTGLRGRWETLRRRPRVICDVGHNEAGISYILEQLATEKYDQLHWVLGLVNDKDTDGILSLMPSDALYYFCKANIPRGMDANELKSKASAFGLRGAVFPSVVEAYQAALNNASKKSLVFVGGSTFVVAEVIS
jgi:dihydrofolate synthase/folylpolyglutamate synthase